MNDLIDALIERLGSTPPDAEALVLAALRQVERMTGQWWGDNEDKTLFRTGDGSRYMALEQAPQGDSLTVEVDGEEVEDYTVRGLLLMRDAGYIWRWGELYDISLTVGGPPPDDVREAILQLAAYWSQNKKGDGKQSETLGDYSYTLGGAEMAERVPGAWAILHARRRVRV